MHSDFYRYKYCKLVRKSAKRSPFKKWQVPVETEKNLLLSSKF